MLAARQYTWQCANRIFKAMNHLMIKTPHPDLPEKTVGTSSPTEEGKITLTIRLRQKNFTDKYLVLIRISLCVHRDYL